MIDSSDSVVIMEGSPVELRRTAERLSDAGIECEIVSPPKGKGSS
jgi:hypothetical protein